ncbi:fumarylacetoacetate hydrolase family protein [Nocardia sp. CA-120079]|uniref:fumarylacetoacetate hydrolase family protein n=1 Tax=Nocardia sp. CA-120079 TaxID=3239974 RepID=UPI003D972A37
MRLLTFDVGTGPRAALQESADGVLIDVAAVARLAGIDQLSSPFGYDAGAVLAAGEAALSRLSEVASTEIARLSDQGAVHRQSEVRLHAPVLKPEKFICVGLNYHDHAAEAGKEIPIEPMFFGKFANSLIGHGATIVPPSITEQVDYEAELAVVIGKAGKNIPEGRALEHVAGVMSLNDVSARDLQLANPLWTGGKAIDTFAPAGPALVLLDEIPDVQALSVIGRVNSTVVQNASTASMIFSVAELIAYLSRIMTLIPGDIIATGTPAGVAHAHGPMTFLRAGDVVEIEIGGVGLLSNPVGSAEDTTSYGPAVAEAVS